jgi:NAD(P)H-hydrate epimerase
MLSREQVRRLDQWAVEKYRVPSIVLMENAGRGVAETMCSLDIDGPVVILVGSGNNGGDGFVIARHLDLLNHEVQIVTATDPTKWQGDTLINFQIAQASGIPICQLPESEAIAGTVTTLFDAAAWIVDAIVGTGASGSLRAPYDQLIRLANESTARRLAIDVPSGLDCDSGEVTDPTFEADHTCTFVASKPGLVAPQAASYVGELHIIDIGAPRLLVDLLLAEASGDEAVSLDAGKE